MEKLPAQERLAADGYFTGTHGFKFKQTRGRGSGA